MPLPAVACLDEDELIAYATAVIEQAKGRTWGATQEMLAELLHVVHAILLILQRGLPTVPRRKLRRVRGKPIEVPRPKWVQGAKTAPDGEVVVTSVRDLARYLK